MKQTLSFLGNGSAFNIKYGNTSAFFKIQSNLILIDCGENIFERIIKRKVLRGIKYLHVFITHTHSDHIGSLSSLIYYCYYIAKIKVNIYFTTSLPTLVYSGNEEYTQYNMNILKVNISQIINLKLNDESIDHLIVIPIRVKHKNNIQCNGYIIDTSECKSIYNTKIWYSGDTNEISKLAMSYNPTEIYHDTCISKYPNNPHCNYKDLMKYFSKEKRNNVYCIHLDKGLLFRLKLLREGFQIPKIFK